MVGTCQYAGSKVTIGRSRALITSRPIRAIKFRFRGRQRSTVCASFDVVIQGAAELLTDISRIGSGHILVLIRTYECPNFFIRTLSKEVHIKLCLKTYTFPSICMYLF